MATALRYCTSMPPTPFRADPMWMRNVLDTATDGVLIEAAERVVYVNEAYAELLGYRRADEIMARTVRELISADDAERLVAYGYSRIAGGPAPSSYDFAALRRDNTSVVLNASVSVTVHQRTAYITTIARPSPRAAAVTRSEITAGPHDALSARERQIMDMILAGKRTKHIALDLDLTETTVATHRSRLLGKIGVADNRELYRYALRHNLVDWS